MYINLVVEDDVHMNILRKVLHYCDVGLEVDHSYGFKGNAYIRKKLPAFNQASRISPYLVLTDLDRYECPPALLKDWIHFGVHSNFIFRIAVREAEAWLIADRENLASFLGISKAMIERNSEEIADPKEYLVNLAKRSRKRQIREDIVPRGTAIVGRNYNFALADFIQKLWDVENAGAHSASLARLMRALNRLVMVS